MIIDFHLHYLRKEGFLDGHLRRMDRAGVQLSVLHALPPFDFLDATTGNNEDVLKAIKKHPDRFTGSLYLDPRDRKWKQTVDKYVSEGFRCVKMHPTVGYYPAEDRFSPVFAHINDLKLPILFHQGLTNFPEADSRYARPIYLDGLLRKYPDMKFVLAHWGGLGCSYEAWSMVRVNPNLYLDTSGGAWGWPGAAFHKMVEGTMSSLDFNKVVWGTDNIYEPQEDIQKLSGILKEIDREEYRDKVLGETAGVILNTGT